MSENVSRETLRLQSYAELFRRWNPAINLASRSDIEMLESRHIGDCAQLIDLTVRPTSWLDLGSGGGLPGVVVSILLQDAGTKVTLVESDARKAAFLRQVGIKLELQNFLVENSRIEALPPQSADVVSARALAALPNLLGYVHRHLAPDGKALLMKGARWRDELEEARQMWHFDCNAQASKTDPDAAILEISNISHAKA
ncbi:MAG: 16S rRNA (guanine(527)-N(7))-methyltransferase RsmG [Paracoccus sp. (in: a-proteobacteria)]|uniref:16S rRNA (guanine(527)-N(7))-methyltransferase RsmG n=1 Tax=Paracoccus sp. TaxID=267 RepID=UPI0026E06DD9|nr:16S rRNA (guanine(527)-N(7))-methyltransferase RsmG [Paracoccus sp. (in: a-proteobacteria)]MDO5621646.1 16S rRNA (guanine(527)-N(7))-methyltransferase RsmG [Paracoccus sp. (in: a-proteobacteria)]